MILFLCFLSATVISSSSYYTPLDFIFLHILLLFLKVKKNTSSMDHHIFWVHSSDLSTITRSEPCFTSVKDFFSLVHSIFFFLYSLWMTSVNIPYFHRSWTDFWRALSSAFRCNNNSLIAIVRSHNYFLET